MDKSLYTSQSTGARFCSGKTTSVRKGMVVPALVVLLGIMFSIAASAQDKIIRKDGQEIHAKVLGTDSKYIRYKRFSNPTGPDYFIFRSEVSKIEYEKAGAGQEQKPLKLAREQANETTAVDLQLLENNALKYKKRSNIYLAAGTAAMVAGAATFIKLGKDYNSYTSEIRKTNDAYTAWYKANYEGSPPTGDLQKKESFGAFATPGIYFGAAAVAGGLALEWIGLKNLRLTRKTRSELAQKKKELSFQPFYAPSRRATGLTIAFSF
ncbi:hypothetical protein ACN9ML_04590 [Dyadobacter endophyticus]|uniref:hypothetical protein n=1 Tax=Dyadobacter TaxID=120831 RepID=UPI003CFAE623